MNQSASFPSSTSRHGLPMLFAGQAQKEFTVNEALARLDLLVSAAVEEERSNPPSGPSVGESFLIGANPSDEWSGHEEAIAGWDGTQWTFVEPVAGMTVRDLSSGSLRTYSGGWQALAAPAAPTGGTTVDTQARDAIVQIVALLKSFGIFS